ncbi:hypothetical protein VUR80DRAFT_1150 [Thermomyces stellatus]
MKNIVVLGGSFAGVSSVHYVQRHVIPQLPDPSSYQVVLVSPTTEAVYRPATVRVLISDDLLDYKLLWTDVKSTLEGQYAKSFRFVHGKAAGLDTEARTVDVELVGGPSEKIEYHALIIATGAATTSPLFSMNLDAASMRETWAKFRAALPGAKSIVLAGGGPTAVETAAELGEHLNGRAGWFDSKLQNPKVPITIVTSDSKLLPDLRESIAQTAEDYLAQLGVTVVKNVKVTRVSPEDSGTRNLEAKTRVSLSDGRELDADIYIPAMGTTPNTSFLPTNLLAKDGRVKVNPSTMRVEAAGPRVYAFGDVSNHHRPSIYFIKLSTPALGQNIKRDLLLAAGRDEKALDPDREWQEDKRETQLVTLGRSKGVGAVMGTRLPNFAVWWLKGRDLGASVPVTLWNGKEFGKP